jgi:hypothetical protein
MIVVTFSQALVQWMTWGAVQLWGAPSTFLGMARDLVTLTTSLH